MLGQPAPLQNTKLPTRGDVANYIKWLAKNQGTKSRKRPAASIFREVTAQVMKIWTDEGIPIHGHKYVIRSVREKCYRASVKIYKIAKRRRQSDWRFGKMGNAYFLKLFDIAKCKCLSREQCNCPEGDRIPAKKWAFISDQRGRRRLTRNGVNSTATGAGEKCPDGGEPQPQPLSSDSTPGPMDIIDIDSDTAASNDVTKEAGVSSPAADAASNDVTREAGVSSLVADAASNDVTREAGVVATERSEDDQEARSPRLPSDIQLGEASASTSHAWYVSFDRVGIDVLMLNFAQHVIHNQCDFIYCKGCSCFHRTITSPFCFQRARLI